MPAGAGLSIPLSFSSGPAVSGGNPNAGPAGTGDFNVYTGGRQSAGQSLAQGLGPWMPVLVLGAAWLMWRRK